MNDIDRVTIMTVNPGFGGQKFISQGIEKISDLAAIKKCIGTYLRYSRRRRNKRREYSRSSKSGSGYFGHRFGCIQFAGPGK